MDDWTVHSYAPRPADSHTSEKLFNTLFGMIDSTLLFIVQNEQTQIEKSLLR